MADLQVGKESLMGISVRNFRSNDIYELVELYNHYIVNTPITFDLEPYTAEQRIEGWLNHYDVVGRYRLLVAECEGNVIGYASSSPFATKAAYDTSVETSIYIRHGLHRTGVGSKLYSELFEVLKREDVHRAYAGITLPNEASTAIHRKFGFEQVGIFREVGRKLGQYWDVAWFEKALS